MLSGAVRERPRVGPWADHGVVVAVRLRPGGRGERGRGAGASGGVLFGVAGVPVGVVPAPVRAARLGRTGVSAGMGRLPAAGGAHPGLGAVDVLRYQASSTHLQRRA